MITRRAIRGSNADFAAWGKANAKNILASKADTAEYGFFLVTATRRTRKYSLKCWSKRDKSYLANIMARDSLIPAASGNVGGTISTSRERSGWISSPPYTPNVSVP